MSSATPPRSIRRSLAARVGRWRLMQWKALAGRKSGGFAVQHVADGFVELVNAG